MRFFLCFLFLLLMCCDAKKAEKEILYSCEAGIDSILQASPMEYEKGLARYFNSLYSQIRDEPNIDYIKKFGYIDGHCLDSENALLLYQDEHTVLEYGNFKKGYYMVDSVVLPLFEFKVFKNRQQIVWQDLNRHPRNLIKNIINVSNTSLTSIYPYKDKIFGTRFRNLVVMDIHQKSFESLSRYDLFEFVDHGKETPVTLYPVTLDLVRAKNDTLILSHRQSEDGFLDSLFITLDGENVIPRISDNRCLKFIFKKWESEYFGDEKKCYSIYPKPC